MKLKVNYDIALTHIKTRKKQTFIASLGVTIGIALYIFSNSLVSGFGRFSRNEMFKTIPHIRIYKEDNISKPLFTGNAHDTFMLISNPQVINTSSNIINPYGLIGDLKQFPFVTGAAPQINVDLFYNNGRSQLKGVCSGIDVPEADAMFNIQSTMVAGSLQTLSSDLNGIVIGEGVAKKLNVDAGDNLTVTSSRGAVKTLRVAGIFSTGNKATDESKSYVNIKTSQQLLKEGPDYITEIYASLTKPDSAIYFAEKIQELTHYRVEDWKTGNADQLARDNILKSMTPMIAISIMMVAAFGIYNILNMTITQKLNDIAILKATGFKNHDIVTIFVSEALFMGTIGTLTGLCLGGLLIFIVSNIYIGPPIGYFPIYFSADVFITGAIFGMLVSAGAGYFPARKAGKTDPVEIFRK